jgi:hypothetical protein
MVIVERSCRGVIEELLPGKIERVVLGHLSRDCNTPELALKTVRASPAKCGRIDVEVHCATHWKSLPAIPLVKPTPAHFRQRSRTLFSKFAVAAVRAAG